MTIDEFVNAVQSVAPPEIKVGDVEKVSDDVCAVICHRPANKALKYASIPLQPGMTVKDVTDYAQEVFRELVRLQDFTGHVKATVTKSQMKDLAVGQAYVVTVMDSKNGTITLSAPGLLP